MVGYYRFFHLMEADALPTKNKHTGRSFADGLHRDEYRFLAELLMRRECTVAELLDHGAMERQALAKLMCRYRKRLVISITTSENAERRSVVLKAKRDCIPTLMERVYALHANRGEWESHLDHEEGETALPDLDSLELAEGYLQAAKQETENSTARELCAKAHDWLDATMDSVAYWERSGVNIPADVRARIDNIKSHFNR